MGEFDDNILRTARNLSAAGFGIHWLHQRGKNPIGKGWSDKPVATFESLKRSYQSGNNIGVRLGEFSRVGGLYLHVFDVDIRKPECAAEAWGRIAEIFPDHPVETLPCVRSGSGGESRHIYFLTDKPFRSRMIAHGGAKFTDSEGTEHLTWEIELYGTGKQVVMPPSIHPDSGKPYVWLREFDFDMVALGMGPYIPAAAIEAAAVDNEQIKGGDASYSKEPTDLDDTEIRARLNQLAEFRWVSYEYWYQIGTALHHQYRGGYDGLEIWEEYSKTKPKYKPGLTRSKWKSFGRNQRIRPISFATIIAWADEDNRSSYRYDAFDEEEEPEQGDAQPDPFDALLGGNAGVKGDAQPDPFDDLLDQAAKPADGLEWTSLLDLNEEGGIKNTQHNADLILMHDPRLKGLAMLNEFTQETVQRIPPGQKSQRRKNQAKPTRQLEGRAWHVKDTLNGELWSDDRDFSIRSIIDAPKTQGGYGYKISLDHLRAAVVNSANNHSFHPVREYLEQLAWDSTPRVETLFIEYLGADDNPYTRSVARLMMVAAVTRIYEPGAKFDFATILEGLQGRRKSTFIQTLGRFWFSELDGDFHDPKQMIELMQGAWIMEIPELSSFGRSDVRSIKAFISRQKDRARLAYARRAGEFPRQCIFIGSTNDREYLRDDTGGRRFWPMACTVNEIDIEKLERNVDQLWGEAVAIYRQMRQHKPHGTLPLYLTDPEAKVIAERLQESRRVESADDACAGQIEAWLQRPINDGGFEDSDEDGTPQYREEVCLIQIWCEALNNDRKSYNQQTAQMLGRAMRLIPGWQLSSAKCDFRGYGRQRFYSKFDDHQRSVKMGLIKA